MERRELNGYFGGPSWLCAAVSGELAAFMVELMCCYCLVGPRACPSNLLNYYCQVWYVVLMLGQQTEYCHL